MADLIVMGKKPFFSKTTCFTIVIYKHKKFLQDL
jgi:hypothetical protein